MSVKDTVLGKTLLRLLDLSEDTLKLIIDLCEKLKGKDAQIWREALRQFLRKEIGWTQKEKISVDMPKSLQKQKKWRKVNGVIYVSVTSNGTAGTKWIEYLEKKGFTVFDDTKKLLLSSQFKATKGVTYEIAILTGASFKINGISPEFACTKADSFKFTSPNIEMLCLICENFSKDELKELDLTNLVAIYDQGHFYHHISYCEICLREDYQNFATMVSSRIDSWPYFTSFMFLVSQTRI